MGGRQSGTAVRRVLGQQGGRLGSDAAAAGRTIRFVRKRALNERDRYIIRRREDGLSYGQLAREVGITRERVRQLLREMRPQWLSADRAARMERHRPMPRAQTQ